MAAKKDGKHYLAEEWVDFVMEQTPEDQKIAMQRHLAAGCADCAGLVGLWSKVGEVARRVSAVAPPASAVQHIRRAFLIQAAKEPARRSWLIPRLVFDSLWQPAMAGVRSSSGGPRHIVYQARGVSIELRVEPEPKSERVNITGQVSLGSSGEQEMAPISVVISSQQGKLASTSTNRFGEFQVSIVPAEGLLAWFAIPPGNKDLLIPLDGAAGDPSGSTKGFGPEGG